MACLAFKDSLARPASSRHPALPLLIIIIPLLLIGWVFAVVPVHAASFVQTSDAGKRSDAADPTSVTATFASPPTAGDLLIAVIAANGSATINAPGVDWSIAIHEPGAVSQAIFYKVADGTETTVTGTVDANPGAIAIHIYEYSGETAFDGAASNAGSGNAPNSGELATSVPNELVFAAFVINKNTSYANSSWNNVGEGFTERNDFKTTLAGHVATYGAGDNLVNSVGAREVTVSATSGTWRGQVISFRNPSPAPTASPTHTSVKPEEISFSILPETCATDPNIQLMLHAHNATDVKISNLPDLSDAEWQPYNVGVDRVAVLDWKLSDDGGEKTVYVRFKNSLNPGSPIESDIFRATVRLDVTTLCHRPEAHAHIIEEGRVRGRETNPECLSDFAHAVVTPFIDGARVRAARLSAGETKYAFDTNGDGSYNDVLLRVERVGNLVDVHLDGTKFGSSADVKLRIDAADRGIVEEPLFWSLPRDADQQTKTLDLARYSQLCESVLAPHPHPGDLIKSPASDVYYYGEDENRHAFPDESVFRSWYPKDADILTVAGYQLATIPLGGNVTLRPGLLTRIVGSAAVYVVDVGRELRPFVSPSLIEALFGPSWATFIREIGAALVQNYSLGTPISSVTDRIAGLANGASVSIDEWRTPPEQDAEPVLHKLEINNGRVVLEGIPYPTGDVVVRFRILGKDGRSFTASDLNVERGERVHLMAMRDDLTAFQHLRPEEHDGLWSANAHFAEDGHHALYLDIDPEGEPPIILRGYVVIGETIAHGTKLPVPNSGMTAEDNPYRLEILTKELAAGSELPIAFLLTKDGKPFTDIRSAEGEYGHLVIVKQDDPNMFIHAHPSADFAPKNGTISFITRFPSPGRYTMFAQFDTGGTTRFFPITIDVPERK